MKFDFTNRNGDVLSGMLEMPKNPPKTFALFAHCFTCSKDFVASNTISKKLAENGIAVLRFDFTGLGNSGGDFANTNFSSNVDDLISACEHLGKKFHHPSILIGHSLGGAAVLKAAATIDSVKAVITIGAPSCASHVSHLFENDLDKIENEGQAEVNLAGRKFTIQKQFIEDIKEADILDGIEHLKKALLILHSPIDNIVSIKHASNIFLAAKHPKSFISLDKADHLLSNKEDANYVGNLIGPWVRRYMDLEQAKTKEVTPTKGQVIVKSRIGSKYTQDVYTQFHHLVADEPASVNGDNLGMSPYELLLAGLGACTSMTIKMYAELKGIHLEEVIVDLKHKKEHASDCEKYKSSSNKIDVIYKSISLYGNYTLKEEKRIYEIAENCPVNKTLQSTIKIISEH